MSQEKSLFGVNLFIQFVMSVFLSYLADYYFFFEILEPFIGILWILFGFGLVYGFFRLFGARSNILESFYQNFPVGFWNDKDRGGSEKPVSDMQAAKKSQSFQWSRIFTFQYLRYLGFGLIFTGIFALLFNIEWELSQKIAFTIVFGAGFLALAELMKHKKKDDFASVSSLFSFGLFQFGLTLLSLYYTEAGNILADPYFWIGTKTVLTLIFIFSLFRYESRVQPIIYFSIAYFTPFFIHESVGFQSFSFEYLIPSLAIISGLLFWITMAKRRYELLLLNVLALNVMTIYFEPRFAIVSIYFLIALFVAHLAMMLLVAAKEQKGSTSVQVMHNVFLHAFTLSTVLLVIWETPVPEILQEYHGVVLLGFAALSFIAYMISQAKDMQTTLTEVLLNTSIIVSAIGLLLQVDGRWTAIVFLVYSCLILWYGMHKRWIRTIIYGFIFLTISIVRLYFVSPDIFDSFTGSGIVVAIGVALLALSYKFEKIKDYIQTFDEK